MVPCGQRCHPHVQIWHRHQPACSPPVGCTARRLGAATVPIPTRLPSSRQRGPLGDLLHDFLFLNQFSPQNLCYQTPALIWFLHHSLYRQQCENPWYVGLDIEENQTSFCCPCHALLLSIRVFCRYSCIPKIVSHLLISMPISQIFCYYSSTRMVAKFTLSIQPVFHASSLSSTFSSRVMSH